MRTLEKNLARGFYRAKVSRNTGSNVEIEVTAHTLIDAIKTVLSIEVGNFIGKVDHIVLEKEIG